MALSLFIFYTTSQPFWNWGCTVSDVDTAPFPPQVKMLALSFLGALKCQTESCSETGLNDTPCQRGKFISSHWECHRLSCPEPRQVMDWIYPSLDKACAQTCTHMHPRTHKLQQRSLHASVCISHRQAPTHHSLHIHRTQSLSTQHTLTAGLKTHVTFSRHLDSWDQRQWCIVSSCMDREKTRQGDSTLIDIRTFVRHLSAYF